MIARTMNGGSSPNKWKPSWKPLLSKQSFDDEETTLLILGMVLVSTSPNVRQGWIGDDLPSTTITNVLAGSVEVYGELWTHDTVMEDTSTVREEVGSVIDTTNQYKKTRTSQ